MVSVNVPQANVTTPMVRQSSRNLPMITSRKRITQVLEIGPNSAAIAIKASEKETTIEGDKGIETVSNSPRSTEDSHHSSKALQSTLTAMGLTCLTTVLIIHKKTIHTCSLHFTDNLVSFILQIRFSPTLLTLLPILQHLLVCRVSRDNTLLLLQLLVLLSTTWEQLMNITMVISLRTILPLLLLRYDLFRFFSTVFVWLKCRNRLNIDFALNSDLVV